MINFSYRYIVVLIIIFILFNSTTYGCTPCLNPLSYGIKDARDGKERYNILLRCHNDAVLSNKGVCYEGIDTLKLEVPEKAKSILLPDYVDFANCVIEVINNSQDYSLFEKGPQFLDFAQKGAEIQQCKELSKKGVVLLLYEDKNPWVAKRSGYDYGAIRKDIVVFKKGKALNTTIAPYNNATSSPLIQYRHVTSEKKTLKNLTFIRRDESKYKTYLFSMNGQYNFDITNIRIKTPNDNVKSGDAAIQIYNSAKISIDNVIIEGTYSQKRKYGYAFKLDNIYDLNLCRIDAHAKWGGFGNFNLNKVLIQKCDINRFDIHCYGRDIIAKDCLFSDLYNQFSSMYGTVIFKNCTFNKCVPFLMESSYNAYTAFDLIWDKCVFYLDNNHNYLMTLSGVPDKMNSRKELSQKCLPNISITNCVVYLDDDVKRWYLIQTGANKYKGSFDHIEEINISGLNVVNEENKSFSLFSEDIKTSKKLNVIMNKK